jgi:hypothetical protein
MEPAIGHREGRLGYDARKRYTKFGSCYCLRRKARQLDLETRPAIRLLIPTSMVDSMNPASALVLANQSPPGEGFPSLKNAA